ncbi:MAG: hypothetical protein HY825_08895 [Acidobacteria bacterium]|nr:hypothetical protein [Acidobacteriota bacterium]
MAAITHTCVQCGKQLTIPERYQGRALKCPECGNPFRVEPPPKQELEAVPPPASPAPEAPVVPPVESRPAPVAAPPPPAPAPFADAPFHLAEPAAAPLVAAPPPAPPVPAGESTLEPPVGAKVYWSLTRIDVFSVAKVAGVVYAALGVIVGVVIALATLAPKVAALPFPLLRGGVAFLAIIGAPILYGLIGFVVGAVMAAIYNLAARLTGGISFLLE